MFSRLSDALLAQALGIFQGQSGGVPGFDPAARYDHAVARQIVQLKRAANFELVQVKGFYLSRAQSVFLRNLTLESMLDLS